MVLEDKLIMNSKLPIIEKLEWGKFVSPVSDRNIPPYNWYSFKHRFGSELAFNIFTMFGLKKGSFVLDPFCGGGTTLIKAKLDGYHSVGIDISPFSVFLSKVLTTGYEPHKLKQDVKKISHDLKDNVEIPDVAILKKSFSDLTLKYIYSLRDSINALNSPGRDFFMLPLLSILDRISKAKKSGGFLRITEQRKSSVIATKKVFEAEALRFINDLFLFKYTKASSDVILGDSRNYPQEVKSRQYDAILTSPPYPNRHDYTRIYELELLVGFICSNQSLKLLRYDTLRSHVEARKKYEVDGCYTIPSLLEAQMNKLRDRNLNNSRIIPTLYGYFEDMYLSLKEMSKVIKKKGHIGLVVSNVRFAGINIPVDEILGEIGEREGLKIRGIYTLRYRGNSSQQMSLYKREPTRESLLVWEK